MNARPHSPDLLVNRDDITGVIDLRSQDIDFTNISDVDNELQAIERDAVLEQLLKRRIIDTTYTLERVEEVLLWADTSMRSFADYRYSLGAQTPVSLADYMRENSMNAEEYGAVYSQEVSQRVDAYVSWCMEEHLPRIDFQSMALFDRLCDEGVDRVNARWQADQYRIRQLARLETDVIRHERQKISREVSSHLPVYERLPSIASRYAQLDCLYSFYKEKREQGTIFELTPLPLKTIVHSVMPSFHPNDTSPKGRPNEGKDIDSVYFDPLFIDALRGKDGVTPIPYNRTQYAQLYTRAEMLGDFGLALWPTTNNDSDYIPAAPKVDSRITAQADVSAGIVWSLLYISAARRGATTVDEDIKIVLPAPIRSSKFGTSSVLMSLYRSNKGSAQPMRFGLAFDLLPNQEYAQGQPQLRSAYLLG